jgi:putative sporulation protein YtxC
LDYLKLTFMMPSEEAMLQLKQRLLIQIKPLLHKVKIVYEVFPRFTEIQCLNTLTQSWKHSERAEISEILAAALADHILRIEELNLLQHLIRNEFAYESEAEMNKILAYSNQMLNEENDTLYVADHSRIRRGITISNEIKHFLKKNPMLNVEGFLKFRLQPYKEELREVVEYAVDEFLMDKQYQEFIALLKYFVFIQEAKIPAVHLMHKGGHEFALYNEQMTPMDISAADDTFKVEILDQDFNFEDLVVSKLISVAPQQIFIHTREPEVQIIQTIMQIFENRVQLCDYCRQCNPILGERIVQKQRYT